VSFLGKPYPDPSFKTGSPPSQLACTCLIVVRRHLSIHSICVFKDGISTAPGVVRRECPQHLFVHQTTHCVATEFVAGPLGHNHTVEGQLTGQEVSLEIEPSVTNLLIAEFSPKEESRLTSSQDILPRYCSQRLPTI